METILLSTDFSPTALNAAKYAARLSTALKSKRIIIYHSYYRANTELMEITDIVIAFPGEDSAIKKEALANLAQLKTELSSLIDKDAQIETITDDRPLLEGIEEIAQKENVDLVVLCGDLTYAEKSTEGIIGPFVKKNKKVVCMSYYHHSGYRKKY